MKTKDTSDLTALSDKEVMSKTLHTLEALKGISELLDEVTDRFGKMNSVRYNCKKGRRNNPVGRYMREVFDLLDRHPRGISRLDLEKKIGRAQLNKTTRVAETLLAPELKNTHRFVEYNGLWYTICQFQSYCTSLSDRELVDYAKRQVMTMMRTKPDIYTFDSLIFEIFGSYAQLDRRTAMRSLRKALKELGLKHDRGSNRILNHQGLPVESAWILQDLVNYLRAVSAGDLPQDLQEWGDRSRQADKIPELKPLAVYEVSRLENGFEDNVVPISREVQSDGNTDAIVVERLDPSSFEMVEADIVDQEMSDSEIIGPGSEAAKKVA